MKEVQREWIQEQISSLKIFKNIYKTIEDLPNIKYKDVVKSEIDQLIEICEKEQKVQKI